MDYGSIINEAQKVKVKAKGEANSRYGWILWLIEVFVALTLLISFPIILFRLPPISTDSFFNFSFRRITDFILNRHINFIVGNAIIAVLLLLSRRNSPRNSNEVSNSTHDSFLDLEQEETGFPCCPAPPMVVAVAAAEEKIFSDIEKVPVKKRHCVEEAVSNAIEDATKQIRRFERKQSEKLKRELRTKHGEKFRRSESEIAVRRRSSVGEVESVDNLSSEQFRLRIEKFIENEKHRRSFSFRASSSSSSSSGNLLLKASN